MLDKIPGAVAGVGVLRGRNTADRRAALLNLPRHQGGDAHRPGHARQRSRTLRRGLPSAGREVGPGEAHKNSFRFAAAQGGRHNVTELARLPRAGVRDSSRRARKRRRSAVHLRLCGAPADCHPRALLPSGALCARRIVHPRYGGQRRCGVPRSDPPHGAPAPGHIWSAGRHKCTGSSPKGLAATVISQAKHVVGLAVLKRPP